MNARTQPTTSLPASAEAIGELGMIFGNPPLMTLAILGDVVHQMSPHRSMHRLVHVNGTLGEWTGYQMIATLDCWDIGEKYLATTDYYRGVLPAIAKITEDVPHRGTA
jgi:hypothetical protein